MLRRRGSKKDPAKAGAPGGRRSVRKLKGTIRVVAGEAWASIREGGGGSIRVALLAANFGKRDLTVDDVRFRHARLGPIRLADPRGLLDERGLTVPARGVAKIFLDLRLGVDDVPRLLHGFEPAANRASSPKMDMECAGDLVLLRRLRTHEEPFLLEHMSVVWTVSDVEGASD